MVQRAMVVWAEKKGTRDLPNPPICARVIVDVRSIDRPLDYAVPDGMSLHVGSLVRVPLRGRSVRGWVVALRSLDDVDENIRNKVLAVKRPLTPVPITNAASLALCEWAAHEYGGSLAAILSWATPAPLPRTSANEQVPPPTQLPTSVSPRRRSGPLASILDAIGGAQPAKAFIRTYPGDNGEEAIMALRSALPSGKCLLVISPSGQQPRLPDDAINISVEPAQKATQAWVRASGATSGVVLAGRHGPLVPIDNLGAVVVTHEHSSTHKDEQAPTLDARVLARELARLHGVPYVAIGPTSPIGNEGVIANAEASGLPVLLATRTRVHEHWPHIEIHDQTTATPGAGRLSERFFVRVRQSVESGGRALVFLNRKGSGRALVCRNCDAVAMCEHCGGLMRPEQDRLVCRDCSFMLPFVACPACGSTDVRLLGMGVNRLATQIGKAFPGVQVLVAAGNNAPLPEPGGILVGTQVAFRHQQKFNLVVLIDPDAELARQSIRGTEHGFHTLIDAVATARPRSLGGHVLVQTRNPSHPALQSLAQADPSHFETAELVERQKQQLPPYRRLLEVSSPSPEAVTALASQLKDHGADVMGPMLAPKPHALALVDRGAWLETMDQTRALALELSHTIQARVRIEADPLDPY